MSESEKRIVEEGSAQIVTLRSGVELVFREGAFVEVFNHGAGGRGERLWLHRQAALDVAHEILRRIG